MAAVLATALSFGSAFAARSDTAITLLLSRPRRVVRRWMIDPSSGRPVCHWVSEEDSGWRFRPHLRIVQA
ncbi:hypothetical protein [Telmatospirillum sp.]|uniref:hypothetical protein n=1 Tax=Telmatospirillum sp. TaxID=2079197 RepID=UPI002840547A|nr:hypothetical protein [Telmatospirillum sp.]MDR3440567.1 hypothetical protein [Telmatospirillum sp.]